jgi:peptide/nickel transport system ATP-binding protein
MSAALKPANEAPLIRLRDLHVKFESRDRTVHAVNGVDLDLAAGEVLCILGESGSGKSVTLRALMKLLPKTAKVTGEIQVAGRDVQAMNEGQLADFRGGDVAMIFQEPMTALDPVFTIGRQIAETVQRHEGASRSTADARALELLELVQIPSAKRRLSAYPHELSGGLRQRAMIAVALACRPKLLLADEPTTALDATVQIQVLLLLRSLQEQLGMGVVFVTHDLGVAGEIADRVAVMYAGKVVEEGPVGALMAGPLHPYAKGLLGATVHAGMRGKRLTTIPGAPPMLDKVPEGCAFAPRCAEATEACHEGVPPLRQIVPGRQARCIRVAPGEGAPHI